MRILQILKFGLIRLRTKLLRQYHKHKTKMPKLSDCRLEPKQTLHCNLNSTHTSSHKCTPLLLPNPEIPFRCSHRKRTKAAALPEKTTIKNGPQHRQQASNMQEQRNDQEHRFKKISKRSD